jgi:hypothetical protein
MPILYGAVAYREDQLPNFDGEIAAWDLQRDYPYPIACPKGGACEVTYRLILEVNASDETSREFIGLVLRQMEQEQCDAHSPRIRMNPPAVPR